VQHTFFLKPALSTRAGLLSSRASASNQQMRYDELVFRWNDLPRDAVASLYLPAWQADDVIALAESLRPGPRIITKVDANTVSFTVGDVAYIPIPGVIQDATPGLLTLQLPQTVIDGQRFSVDVQHHTGLTFRIQTRPTGEEKKAKKVNLSHRHVLGAFQVRVVVGSGEPLLRKLVRHLAALRYIFQAIPTTDTWHPVFSRYLYQLGDQIAGLGLDPALVPASPDDPGLPGEACLEEREQLTGKVREVIFDCFGDFIGFTLESCSKCHHVSSRKKGVAEIVLRACHDGCTVTVYLGEAGLRKIIVRC
jgi:hypothetical protein